MFSLSKKLDTNLRDILNNNDIEYYRVLIKYKTLQDSISKKISSYKGQIIRKIESCNIICAKLNSKSIYRLIEYPEIEFICLDEYFSLCGMSIPTANKIRISNKLNISGKGIGVGVIDSGVYPHRDLTYPSNRIITFIDLINGLPYPYDDNGHGTCTCGIIGGNGESSNKIYCGLAKEATIHCYKAFNKLGRGYASDVLFAIEDLISISKDFNIKVLCLPFESLNYNKFIYIAFDTLLKKAISNSLIPILPSGSNENVDSSIIGLALSKNCITVSGINTVSKPESYSYSSCGPTKKPRKPDFCAACVDVVSLNCNTSYISFKGNSKVFVPKLATSYKSFTGTSVAAAYVAGVCALLFEYNKDLSFDDVFALLKVASTPLDIPKNQQGNGVININKIINNEKHP